MSRKVKLPPTRFHYILSFVLSVFLVCFDIWILRFNLDIWYWIWTIFNNILIGVAIHGTYTGGWRMVEIEDGCEEEGEALEEL